MSNKGGASSVYDLLVIGGGINGAGIACDAAARGLKTALVESNDFAAGTSSRSSKLVHGGLRYLEYYDFRLVRESLSERERIMNKARHICWPLRFVMPVVPSARAAWMVRIGLFLYDHLAKRATLPGTESVKLDSRPDRLGFAKDYEKAFIYSDCWVDDARLVIANLQGAARNGAVILPRTRFADARREDGHWVVDLQDSDTGARRPARAKVVVNAAGPWAISLASNVQDVTTNFTAKLVRGSHIIVPKLYEGDHGAMLQLGDGRIVVTMPYENDYTLVGTTDHEDHGDPRAVTSTSAERHYLIAAANTFFARKSSEKDIVWEYSGVRPLFEEGTSRDKNPTTITRDYSFKIDRGVGGEGAVFLTVLGGKLTTYRRLAAHVLAEITPFLPEPGKAGETENVVLPGGDIPAEGPKAFAEQLMSRYTWLAAAHAQRLARTYGSLAFAVLGDARSTKDLGFLLGDDLYSREVEYLVAHEWAMTAEDILWRRTKCGLRFKAPEIEALSTYLRDRAATQPSKAQSA